METTTQNNNNGSTALKVVIVALLLALIGLGTYTYRMQNENTATVDTMTTERDEITKQLASLEADYTAEIEKGTELSDELIAARDRINALQNQLKNQELTEGTLKKLHIELGKVKNEREVLLTKIAQLEKDNEYLVKENDSTKQILSTEIATSALKSSRIDSLNNTVQSDRAKAAVLMPTNFSLKGLIIRNSGKEIENDKARRVDDLKVCFTLPTNAFAKTGVSSFYLQVINPENNVIGSKKTVQLDGEKLTYSKIVQFNYKGTELDICELVGADEDEIVKGNYRVSLYNGSKRVSSSELSLR